MPCGRVSARPYLAQSPATPSSAEDKVAPNWGCRNVIAQVAPPLLPSEPRRLSPWQDSGAISMYAIECLGQVDIVPS
jgi:hypothetical protein